MFWSQEADTNTNETHIPDEDDEDMISTGTSVPEQLENADSIAIVLSD